MQRNPGGVSILEGKKMEFSTCVSLVAFPCLSRRKYKIAPMLAFEGCSSIRFLGIFYLSPSHVP